MGTLPCTFSFTELEFATFCSKDETDILRNLSVSESERELPEGFSVHVVDAIL